MTEIRKLYDRLGRNYLESMYLNNSWTKYVDRSEKRAVTDIWGINPGRSKHEAILDLGMGPGRWSKFFVSQGFKNVVGLDLSPRMVKEAVKYVGSSKFKGVKGDIEKLPFLKGSFNKVFCFRAFKYIPNPEKAIDEIKRVLQPRGTMVLELSNKTLVNRFFQKVSSGLVKLKLNFPLDSRIRYFANTRFYTRTEAFELVNSRGLKVVSYRYFAMLPSIPLPAPLTKLWIWLDGILFEILPKNLFSRSMIFLISK